MLLQRAVYPAFIRRQRSVVVTSRFLLSLAKLSVSNPIIKSIIIIFYFVLLTFFHISLLYPFVIVWKVLLVLSGIITLSTSSNFSVFNSLFPLRFQSTVDINILPLFSRLFSYLLLCPLVSSRQRYLLSWIKFLVLSTSPFCFSCR